MIYSVDSAIFELFPITRGKIYIYQGRMQGAATAANAAPRNGSH